MVSIMALCGKPRTTEHSDESSCITKCTNRKSKASRSLVDHFNDESAAELGGRRANSRLRERQNDSLSESLLCEVDDDSSRVISEFEQSTTISGLGKLDLTNDDMIKPNSHGEVKKTYKNGVSDAAKVFGKWDVTTTRARSDSTSSDGTTVSLNNFECAMSYKIGSVTENRKNRSSCKSADKAINSSKGNSHQGRRSRLSSASHNATRGSLGSPQLVEESPDVPLVAVLASKSHHGSRNVSDKPLSMLEQSTPVPRSAEFKTPVRNGIGTPDNMPENVTSRSRKELGLSSAERSQGKELFKKLLTVARETLARSAQRAATSPVVRSSPGIDGITSLTKAMPTSQHKKSNESSKVTPTHQLHAIDTPLRIRTPFPNRSIPATPKTPKSVHFRDFPQSPSLSKMSLHRSALCSPRSLSYGDSFKTPEQQIYAPANAEHSSPVNQMMPQSDIGVHLPCAESPIPDTQPVSSVLLKGVVAYVEVRSNGEDRSAGVKSHLQELGATVVNRLNKKVTHILFKEGLLSTYNKAMNWHIPLVTVQWIEECKKHGCVVSERLFVPSNLDDYQSPDPLKKIKRVKYFRTDAEDDQKFRRTKQKRLEKLKAAQVETDASTETDTDSVVENSRGRNGDKDTSANSRLMRTLQKLVNASDGSCMQDDSSSPTSDDMCVPLAVRLLRQLQNNDSARNRSEGSLENVDGRSADCDKNVSEKFVGCESSKGSENRSPRHVNIKLRRKLCVQNEKHSVPLNCEEESTVSNHQCSNVQSQMRTVSSKKTVSQNDTAKDDLSNSKINSTFNSSVMLNSTKGKGHKRKLMPLSQSSSPTVVDTTLISQESPSNFIGGSKRRKTCPRISEEMDLTQCVAASNDCDTEVAGTSATTPVTSERQQCTQTASVMKRSRKRLARRSLSMASQSQSPPLVVSRRSSGVFIKVKPKYKRLSRHFPTVVLTSFTREDGEMIAACVVKLGRFQLEAKVSGRTTHIVSNGSRRTLNMLKGIARGCWILTQDWVHGSLEAGRWLPEEPFEIKTFSPAITQCRMERECLGPGFRLDLFQSCGSMVIAKQSKPPAEDLKELVQLCGGQLATSIKDADIAVGLNVRSERITCLSEKWILDSITQLRIQPTDQYILDRRQSNCVG